LQGGLRKIKPPSFDGENKKGEDAEAWLLRMRNISNYITTHQMQKPKIITYHLEGKGSMWWD
jgi:hypothetical protein